MSKNHKITDIKVSNKNNKKIIIYINDQLLIETDDAIINEFDLYIGKTITDHLVDIIQQREIFNIAKNDSLHFLSYRARSEQEMIQKLQNKKYQSDIIDKTIYWLKENDFINDREFCFMWIKDRINHNPMGKLKIRKELYDKGINNELIENVMNSFFEKDEDELDLAYQLINKKRNSAQSKNIEFEPKKIINLLKYRGFSGRVINHVYDELFTH